jgi:hypothetical protein
MEGVNKSDLQLKQMGKVLKGKMSCITNYVSNTDCCNYAHEVNILTYQQRKDIDQDSLENSSSEHG